MPIIAKMTDGSRKTVNRWTPEGWTEFYDKDTGKFSYGTLEPFDQDVVVTPQNGYITREGVVLDKDKLPKGMIREKPLRQVYPEFDILLGKDLINPIFKYASTPIFYGVGRYGSAQN